MGRFSLLRTRASFELPIVLATTLGSVVTVLFYVALIYGPIDSPLLKRYCLCHAVAEASVWMFFIAMVGMVIKLRQAQVQRRITGTVQQILDQMVQEGDSVARVKRSGWLEAHWLGLPTLYRDSWVGRRVQEIIERQIKRGKHSLLENDIRELAEADADAQHDSFAIVRIISWAMPMLGFLGTVLGISDTLGQLDTELLASQSQAALNQMTSGLFVAFDTTAIALVLTILAIFVQFSVSRVESGLLGQMDKVVRDTLVEFLGSEARQTEQEFLTPVRQMADDLIQAVHTLVEQQANLWSRSITETQQQWAGWSATSGEQLRAALSESLDKSLSQHAQHIERLQLEAGRQVDSRWQQWQITLSDQARVMHAQQKELVRQTESIDKLVSSTCDLKKVEDAVRESFGSFELVEQLRQATIGVSEAVAVLASSLERSGIIRGMPVKPRAIRKFDPDRDDTDDGESGRASKEEVCMTRSKSGASDLAPSLFPFLAVLLCTVGALVLLLVLVVGQSQAAVKQATDEKKQQSAELRVQVELIRDGFKEDREKLQLAIEKKRLMLQGLEKQSSDLLKEIDGLAKTAEQIDKQLAGKDPQTSDAAKLTDLQQQLREAAEKLKSKLSQPSGDKPVFAIIPYEGTNGTHRRPIYLECRSDGIMVQPEGVLIGIKDLKPPYGPGNPLDATLRTIRTFYSPQGSALQSSAYPLLVVRSSGIRTYALARMAMAGWDDQFGYELIEDDAELTFPESEPGLSKQIEQTLVAARNRQAALVMAMPGRFRQAMEELSADNLDFDPIEGDGDGSGSGFGGSGSSTNQGEAGAMADGRPMAIGAGGPGRGGFAFAPDAAGGPAGSRPGNLPGPGPSGSSAMGFATGGDSQGQAPALAAGNAWQMGQPGSPAVGSAALPDSSFAQGALSGDQFTRGGGDGSLQGQPGEAGGQMASDSRKADARSAAGTRPGNFRDAMAAARSKQLGNADSQSSSSTVKGANSSAADTGSGGSQLPTAQAEGVGSLTGSPSEISADPTTPSAQMSARKAEKIDAVAKRKGRNWAWAAGPARETAVVRTIRVACYQDRWIVLPEQYGTNQSDTIMLDVAMQSSAEQLAKVIADRVDRWGLALSGGYWKPVLEVEVIPGAEQRYEQLRRLLDGSGLEVRPVAKAAASPTKRPVGR